MKLHTCIATHACIGHYILFPFHSLGATVWKMGEGDDPNGSNLAGQNPQLDDDLELVKLVNTSHRHSHVHNFLRHTSSFSLGANESRDG